VFELLINDPEHERVKTDSAHKTLSSETNLEELIEKETGESEIIRYALSHGMVTMQQDGVLKALTGLTTFEEVEAVTGQIDWLREK
jgi:type II secretory ATPase GspE/PulE/Tfp pilus assembly ATPase PilB-like protein